MKTIAIAILLALAVSAVAQSDMPAASMTASPDGIGGSVDLLAVGEKIDAATWTGFKPAVWWTRNIQPVKFVQQNWKGMALAAAAAGAYAIYENNDGSGGSSKSKAQDPTAPSILQSGGGDVYIFTASGDGANVVLSQTTSTVGAGAATPAAE